MFPSTLRQNDTLSFTITLDSDYDSYTLTYYLNSMYSTEATFADGVFTVYETDTNWEPGSYDVQGVVTNGSFRETVEVTKVQILPDLSVTADSSSHVKNVLDAIEATILGAASKEQESYEVAGRSLKYKTLDELLKLREVYKAEWASEQKAADLAQGVFSNTIKVRFG